MDMREIGQECFCCACARAMYLFVVSALDVQHTFQHRKGFDKTEAGHNTIPKVALDKCTIARDTARCPQPYIDLRGRTIVAISPSLDSLYLLLVACQLRS